VTDRNWGLRKVPDDLVADYLKRDLWTDASLGDMVAAGLGSKSGAAFRVHSQVHPWSGSFGEVDRAARSLAAALQARGVGPGGVVAFQIPNWVEAGITFWAAAYLGAAVVPIVHFYGPKEVDYILRVTQPDVVITADKFGQSDFGATYADLLPKHGSPLWLLVDSAGGPLPPGATRFSDLLDTSPIEQQVKVDPDSVAVIAFTSGTTRDPKGVIHSQRTIGCETRQLHRMFPDLPPPPITGAPVGHFIGMVNAFLVPLMRTTPVNLVDVWDPGRILKLMLDDNLAMAGGATYFLTSILDHPDFTDEHRKRMPFSGLGGSTVPIAVTDRAERLGIKCYRSYGSTEHPSITVSYLEEPQDKRCMTDGHVIEGVEIRLGEDGEIFSRGPDLCLGYTDPELTAAAFDAEGWYRTGDVGVLDSDGYLTITDRVSDIIIRGGENISAQEVEELMLGMEAIAEVGVVAAPDDRLGEHAAAVVRVRPGAKLPTLAQIREHLAGVGLAKQKWPESLHEVADFPRTPSGKVQKFHLRQMLRDGKLPAVENR
jgi:acyl-CoA synthetase (AMP-forming)/AMP-acid ligase II